MLRVPTAAEVRARIEAIRDEEYTIPSPSAKFPDGVRRIDGSVVKITSKLALIGGFRISEICRKYSPRSKGANTSNTLRIWVDEHRDTGEEALRIQVATLKKNYPILRDIGVPLDPYHEPFSRPILEAWEKSGGNPCDVSRQDAWYVNREAFDGFGYRVSRKLELKPAGNHFLRHMRAIELKDMQVSAEDRVSFFKWSAGSVGLNQMIMTYSESDWFDYFPRLLKKRR